MVGFTEIITLWQDAEAFLVEGCACSVWSVDEQNKLMHFSVYHEDGMKEYELEIDMIDKGVLCPENSLVIDYKGSTIQIVPLFTR